MTKGQKLLIISAKVCANLPDKSGELKVKKQKSLTIENIAEKTGLSVSTISRVLNGKAKQYRICDATAELILKTAREMNYTPNQLARGLRLNKTFTIGYIIPDISNPFFAGIARTVEKFARKMGYSVIISDSEEDTKLEISSVRLLLERKIDGLIISPVGNETHHLTELKKRNIPIVLIDRYFPELGFPFITSENYKGALEAVSYLIENGHRRIACIQGLQNAIPNVERVRGYIDAHKKFKLEIDESLIAGDSFGEENGYVETKLLLRRKTLPTAIFGVSNLISLGALKALREEGLSVPGDISLITFDDQPYLDFMAPPVTSVKQQISEIGNIATKLLLDNIDSGKSTGNEGIYIPTKLIIRNSVKNILDNHIK